MSFFALALMTEVLLQVISRRLLPTQPISC